MNHGARSACVAAGLAVTLVAGCSSTSEKSAVQPPRIPSPALADATPRDYPGLHNVVAYHDGYFSGSVPEGDAGFETLAAMGVKTIISVDGAAPEVERARALGIRYVHLPIGYNGFDEERRLELARASSDALKDGSVYVHCHHGKHRSAGAAAAVGVSLGWGTPEEMVARMKVSGTAPNYTGLYKCAADSTELTPGQISAVPANFPEISQVTSFVKGMVEVDEVMEHLKAIEKAGWKAPPDHPDLVPVAEAGRLADLLRQLSEGGRASREPEAFAKMMARNSAEAQAVEDGLLQSPVDASGLSAKFKIVAASCKECHEQFRD